MTRRIALPLLPAVLLASLCFAAPRTHWVATWAFSPSPQVPDAEMLASGLLFNNQTIREIVHTSIGGAAVRVRLSNIFGTQPVEIASAHIALRATGADIVAASGRALTFGGRPAVTIPSNAIVLSDPVKLDVPASADLAISLFLPKPTAGAGIHYSAQQTQYVAQGDLTSAPSLPSPQKTLSSWVFLAGVDVEAADSVGTVVAFGDSITDGALSTSDSNRRWPDVLAARLLARHGAKPVAVIDAGIGGNRVLHDARSDVRYGVNALARFERDALAQPGVRWIIILEGINDLGDYDPAGPESEKLRAEDLIAGLRQMIERAHELGIKVYGATILPFGGVSFGHYFTPEKDTQRKAINQWIRTSGAFDGVVDFEKATQDPANPDRMLPAYDSGDHLHPNDAGYKAMGEAVDLTLFK